MNKFLDFLGKIPIWYVAFGLWGALCIKMCATGYDDGLTSKQGGQGYMLAFAFLLLAHIYRCCYKHLKSYFDQAKKQLQQEIKDKQ